MSHVHVPCAVPRADKQTGFKSIKWLRYENRGVFCLKAVYLDVWRLDTYLVLQVLALRQAVETRAPRGVRPRRAEPEGRDREGAESGCGTVARPRSPDRLVSGLCGVCSVQCVEFMLCVSVSCVCVSSQQDGRELLPVLVRRGVRAVQLQRQRI